MYKKLRVIGQGIAVDAIPSLTPKQAIEGPKKTSLKQFKQDSQRSNQYEKRG